MSEGVWISRLACFGLLRVRLSGRLKRVGNITLFVSPTLSMSTIVGAQYRVFPIPKYYTQTGT